jgi:hypothetical protein
MCAYKVVKAYCGYWGVQNRAEKFICKGVRDIFLLTHRNCFCWLDQWHGLTYEQVSWLRFFRLELVERLGLHDQKLTVSFPSVCTGMLLFHLSLFSVTLIQQSWWAKFGYPWQKSVIHRSDGVCWLDQWYDLTAEHVGWSPERWSF